MVGLRHRPLRQAVIFTAFIDALRKAFASLAFIVVAFASTIQHVAFNVFILSLMAFIHLADTVRVRYRHYRYVIVLVIRSI